MGNIYRKAAMDRLASPEQLDKMIRIASPSLWIAVAGAGMVVVSVLAWAIFGSLPTNVSISGLYMSDTGVQGAYASYGGKVTELLVEKDQQVEKGEVVAVLSKEDQTDTVGQFKERIAAVESVTLSGTNDTATSDNSKLLEYKLQYQQAGMTREQKEETVRALQKQLEQAKQKTAACKAGMDAAEAAYLAAVSDDGMNTANFHYQKAQNDLAAAQNEYQAIYSRVQSLESAAAQAAQPLQGMYDQYAAAEGQYQQLDASCEEQLSQLSDYQEQYRMLQEQYTEGEIPEEVQKQLASLESVIAGLKTSTASLQQQMTGISDSLNQLSESIRAAESQSAEYQNQLSQARWELESAENGVSNAKSAFASAESVYQSYYTTQNDRAANQSGLNSAFSEASSLYSNAYNQQQSIEQQLASVHLETSFETENEQTSREAIEQQFDAAKAAILKDLKQELKKAKKSIEAEQILAPISGTVIECAVQKEQLVGQGAEILRVKNGGEDAKEIVRCYVPIAEGKKFQSGMKVVVTPSTVSEDEYGHMFGTVESVGTYTVTNSEMQKALGNDTMVQALQQQGPSVEVLLVLEKEEGTASGYAWSNKKGENVTLEENTPVSAKVRIKEDAPISKLIPFLKGKLDTNTEAAQ